MKIMDLQEKPTLSIRQTTSVKDLPDLIGRNYGKIMAYMGKAGVEPSGAPFVMYYNLDMENLDVEMGFPVPEGSLSSFPAEGVEDIRKGKLPGGKTAYALHTGPYETMEKAYNDLTAFVEREGCKPESFVYEVYLNSPTEVPAEELQTEIFFPLK